MNLKTHECSNEMKSANSKRLEL